MWGRFSWRLFLAMSKSEPVGRVNTFEIPWWSYFKLDLSLLTCHVFVGLTSTPGVSPIGNQVKIPEP